MFTHIERVINRTFSNLSANTLFIGRTGENNVTGINIDVTKEIANYPSATFELLLSSPDFPEEPHPVVSETKTDDTTGYTHVRYVFNGYDTHAAGFGRMELVMYGVNGEVLKSAIVKTRIDSSLLNENVYPESVQAWIDFFREQRSTIHVVYQDLPEEGKYGEMVYLQGGQYHFDGLYLNLNPIPNSTEASWTLVAPSDPMIVEETTYGYLITLNGQSIEIVNGISPTVRIENIDGGHRIIITDSEHPSGQIIDIMDGDAASGESDWTSDANGIPHYKGKSIYNYVRDFLDVFELQSDDLYVDDVSELVEFDEDDDLYIDSNVIDVDENNDLHAFVDSIVD